MDPKKIYRFCPRCGGALIAKEESLQCASCKNDLYINPAPCNGVIIENEKNEILLVKRKFEPHKGLWDLPGGFIRTNESLLNSITREIQEELSVKVEVNGILGGYEDSYIYQEVSHYTLGIIVTAKIIEGTINVSDDVESYEFFAHDQVLKQEIAFPGIRKAIEDYLEKINRVR